MAVGVDAAAPGAGRRLYRHRGGGRRRVRRQRDAPPHLAPGEVALCVGRIVRSQGISGDPGARGAAAPDRQRASAHPPSVAADLQTVEARAWAATQPPRAWRLVSWRNGTNPAWRARFCAVRVTPAHDWRDADGSLPKSGCSASGNSPAATAYRYYLVDLPPTAPLRALVQLAHQRWAIEQQYQELKDEIGLDHFEGRSLPGWQRHVVLTAIAYSFLQHERGRRGQTQLTLPQVRAVIQEVLTAHFFMTHPGYLEWMLKLKDVQLRI